MFVERQQRLCQIAYSNKNMQQNTGSFLRWSQVCEDAHLSRIMVAYPSDMHNMAGSDKKVKFFYVDKMNFSGAPEQVLCKGAVTGDCAIGAVGVIWAWHKCVGAFSGG